MLSLPLSLLLSHSYAAQQFSNAGMLILLLLCLAWNMCVRFHAPKHFHLFFFSIFFFATRFDFNRIHIFSAFCKYTYVIKNNIWYCTITIESLTFDSLWNCPYVYFCFVNPSRTIQMMAIYVLQFVRHTILNQPHRNTLTGTLYT